MKVRRKGWLCFLILLIALITIMNYVRDIQRGINKPDMQNPVMVSASRHLEELTATNHKYGSEGNTSVELYIKSELDGMDVAYTDLRKAFDVSELFISEEDMASLSEEEREEADAYAGKFGFNSYLDYHTRSILEYEGLSPDLTYEMQGIFVKLDCPDSDEGVMLVCHYDNAPNGTGAADDGTAVAGMIEAIRTASQMKRTNDIYFLFTNGEEVDLIGAYAFLELYPGMEKFIPLVLNYEARGVSGSLLLFETSGKNAGTVKEVLKALHYETGYSIFSDIYQWMPNYTDLTAFMKSGYQGINFAYAEDSTAYHNLTDNVEYLSEQSFYETVMNQQDMVTYFASSDLQCLHSNQDVVFFPLLKGRTVVLNRTLLLILAGIVIIGGIILTCFLIRSKADRDANDKKTVFHKKTLQSILLFTIAIISCSGTVLLTELPWTVKFLSYQTHFIKLVDDIGFAEDFLQKGRRLNVFFLVFLILIFIFVFWLTTGYCKKHMLRQKITVASLIVGIIMAVVSVLVFKGGSYIVVLPLLFYEIAIATKLPIFEKATHGSMKAERIRTIIFGSAAGLQMIGMAMLLMPVLRLLSVCMQLSIPIYCDAVICALWTIAMIQVTVPFLWTLDNGNVSVDGSFSVNFER